MLIQTHVRRINCDSFLSKAVQAFPLPFLAFRLFGKLNMNLKKISFIVLYLAQILKLQQTPNFLFQESNLNPFIQSILVHKDFTRAILKKESQFEFQLSQNNFLEPRFQLFFLILFQLQSKSLHHLNMSIHCGLMEHSPKSKSISCVLRLEVTPKVSAVWKHLYVRTDKIINGTKIRVNIPHQRKVYTENKSLRN